MNEPHDGHPADKLPAERELLAELDTMEAALRKLEGMKICFRCYERRPVEGPFCADCWAEIERLRRESQRRK